MSAIKRMIQIVDYKGISKRKFYDEIGLSNGYLDKEREVGHKKLELICSRYPDINPVWLLMGKGEMLLSEAKEEDDEERIEDLKAHIADLRAENEFLKEQIRELNKKRPAQEDAECADVG